MKTADYIQSREVLHGVALSEHGKKAHLYFNFLKLYSHNAREIGSIVPDSRLCVEALLRYVPFASAKTILEYGGASGSVTREIVKRKSLDATFLCFEKNREFHKLLVRDVNGQNVYIINDDVLNSVGSLSTKFGISPNGVDCIISTLPCSSMNLDELFPKCVFALLKKDGFYIQYMHVFSFLKGFRLKPHLTKYFSEVHCDFVFINFPPALVYTSHKMK
jgi:phospholipid N-methyltransferase